MEDWWLTVTKSTRSTHILQQKLNPVKCKTQLWNAKCINLAVKIISSLLRHVWDDDYMASHNYSIDTMYPIKCDEFVSLYHRVPCFSNLLIKRPRKHCGVFLGLVSYPFNIAEHKQVYKSQSLPVSTRAGMFNYKDQWLHIVLMSKRRNSPIRIFDNEDYARQQTK
jgi:hypothetical protein